MHIEDCLNKYITIWLSDSHGLQVTGFFAEASEEVLRLVDASNSSYYIPRDKILLWVVAGAEARQQPQKPQEVKKAQTWQAPKETPTPEAWEPENEGMYDRSTLRKKNLDKALEEAKEMFVQNTFVENSEQERAEQNSVQEYGDPLEMLKG